MNLNLSAQNTFTLSLLIEIVYIRLYYKKVWTAYKFRQKAVNMDEIAQTETMDEESKWPEPVLQDFNIQYLKTPQKQMSHQRKAKK